MFAGWVKWSVSGIVVSLGRVSPSCGAGTVLLELCCDCGSADGWLSLDVVSPEFSTRQPRSVRSRANTVMLILHGCAGLTSCRLDSTSHLSHSFSYLISPEGLMIINVRRYGAASGTKWFGGAIVRSVSLHAIALTISFSWNSSWSWYTSSGPSSILPTLGTASWASLKISWHISIGTGGAHLPSSRRRLWAGSFNGSGVISWDLTKLLRPRVLVGLRTEVLPARMGSTFVAFNDILYFQLKGRTYSCLQSSLATMRANFLG